MKHQPLNCREQEVLNHLRKHRPRMFRELKASGRLDATVKRMWEEYGDQLDKLTLGANKIPYDQALELVREVAFPPDENDQPHLGENPDSLYPTSVETAS